MFSLEIHCKFIATQKYCHMNKLCFMWLSLLLRSMFSLCFCEICHNTCKIFFKLLLFPTRLKRNESSSSVQNYFHLDSLQKKLKDLEEENVVLRSEVKLLPLFCLM